MGGIKNLNILWSMIKMVIKTRLGSQRYNNKMAKIWEQSRRLTTLKSKVLSKIRKGEKITQAEADRISTEDYRKAKNQYRGYKKRKRK